MNSKLEKTLKKGVLQNKKYDLKPIDCSIKLNQNESPFDVPGPVKDQILQRLKEKKWNIYPDFVPSGLYDKIAAHLGVKSNNILIGNGSNEMILTVLGATIETGKTVVIPTPTFTVYQLISSNYNGNIETVYLNEDFSFNIEALCTKAAIPGSVTIISTPNNPTGNSVSREDLEKIIKTSQGIVVIDEAYIHFGGQSCIDLIDTYENLIILRTFSKAFGLAGLRIGMMIGNEQIITNMSKVKLPYNLSIFNLAALDVIFDNIETINEHIEYIIKEKKYVEQELQKFDSISVIPSDTNFFCVKVNDSKKVFTSLVEKDILVRDVSAYPMLENYLRISVGSKEENRKLLKALGEIL